MKLLPTIFPMRQFLMMALIISLIPVFNPLSAQTSSGEEGNDTEQSRTRYRVKKKYFNYNNVISIYPLQAVSNYMALGYEFKTGEKSAFKTMAGYAQKEGSFYDLNGNGMTLTKLSGFRIEMQFKYFISKKTPVFNGIYFGPFVQYKACNFNYEAETSFYDPNVGYYVYQTVNKKDKAAASYIGFLLGYHARLNENFTLDMFAGEGLMSSSGNYKTGSRLFDQYSNAIRLRAGFDLGFGL